MKQVLSLALKCALVAGFCAVLYFTSLPFLMVGGSDSTSFLIAPPLAVQVTCVAVLAAALFWPARRRLRTVLLLPALAAIVVGGHRLVVDNLHGEVRDIYLATTVQALALDPAIEGGVSMAFTAAGFRIGQAGAGPQLWVFSPPWIGLDPRALAVLAGQPAS